MDTVIITKKEYKDLLDDQLFLDSLIGTGVDNWEGYESAVDSYKAANQQLDLEEDNE